MARIIVREILKSKGVSIKELAFRMGISPSAVSQLLANEYPSMQVLERIAKAIDVDILDFFAQRYSYLNGYVETGGEIYPVRSREQFMEVTNKVDGIVHIPSFKNQADYKNIIREFLSNAIDSGKSDALMARYNLKEIFTLTYDANSEKISLTLCISDGEIKFKIFDTAIIKVADNFSNSEMNSLLEAILSEIEDVDKEDNHD
jgi:transcriptional regulator with XRE-family HTH domain